MTKKKKGLVATVIFTLVSILYVSPLFIVLMNSFKKKAFINLEPFSLPSEKTFIGPENYLNAVDKYGFLQAVIWTVVITVGSVLVILLCTSMFAWYITRVKSSTTKLLYLLCVFSMVVPFQMVMFTLSNTADKLKLNTPWTIPVVYLGFGAGLAIFMFVGFVKSIPLEIEEAARIDGAGHFTTMWKIMLPQAMNLGSVIILNSVIAAWNAWLPASIYVPRSRHLWPLQLVINQLINENKDFLDSANPDYSKYLIQFAAIIVAAAPLILLFPFFQNKLEKGVIGGGVKG